MPGQTCAMPAARFPQTNAAGMVNAFPTEGDGDPRHTHFSLQEALQLGFCGRRMLSVPATGRTVRARVRIGTRMRNYGIHSPQVPRLPIGVQDLFGDVDPARTRFRHAHNPTLAKTE